MIRVCLLTNNLKSDKVKKLSLCFKDKSIFALHMFDTSTSNIIKDKDKEELYWCLKQLYKNYKDDYVLIIKDDVLTTLQPEILSSSLKEIIDIKDLPWDILYLSAWGDNCKKFEKIKNIGDFDLVKTRGPTGSSCILITPGYLKTILSKNKLKAYAIMLLPLPFTYDLMESDGKNIYKTNLQQINTNTQSNSMDDHTYLSIYWYLGIIIFFLILIGIVIYPKYKNMKNQELLDDLEE